jgi:hypothetical protein
LRYAATCDFSFRVATGLDSARNASMARLVARSMPRLISMALTVGKNCVSENGRGAGAVAHQIAGLLRRLTQHSRAEIFFRILEIELLGNRNPVIADDGRALLFFDQYRFGPRSESHTNRVRELCGTAQDLFPRCRAKQDLPV